MKFKSGDKVFDTESIDYGLGTVTEVNDGEVYVKFPDDQANWLSKYEIVYYQDEQQSLVLEAVYNSPLYKALL